MLKPLLSAGWLLSLVGGTTMPSSASSAQDSIEIQESITTRESLASRIRAAWPVQGSLHVEYADQRNHALVGYDFATGGWYRVTRREHILLRDADGQIYFGSARPGELHASADSTGDAYMAEALDDYFPQLQVVRALETEGIRANVESRPEGGFLITASLPRGSWYPIAKLHDVEIDRWGGRERLMRDVVYEIDGDLSVVARTRPINPSPNDPQPNRTNYDRDSRSPSGFQVTSADASMVKIRLVNIRCSPESEPQAFTSQAVFDTAIAARVAFPQRTPIVTSAQVAADPNAYTPLDGKHRSRKNRSIVFIGAGGVLVLLGLAAWWRARRA